MRKISEIKISAVIILAALKNKQIITAKLKKQNNLYFWNDRLKTIKLFFLLTGDTRPPFSFEKEER